MVNSLTRSLLLGLLAFIASLPAISVRGETPRELVERNLDELHRWLESSTHADGWKGFLLSSQLEAELSKPAPDTDAVSLVLARYHDSNPGLSRRRFVAVRSALEQWNADLSAPSPSALAASAREAVDEFNPPSAEDLAQLKQRLSSAASRLDQFLARGGKQKEEGWKKHLHFNETLQQLDAEQPNVGVLRVAELKYFGLFRGLELPVFDAVRQNLRKYTNALIIADPRASMFYSDQVNRLAGLLDALELPASSDQSLAIARILGVLEMAGQADPLVDRTRRIFSRPNLHVQVSEDLLAASANAEVHTRQRIRENILGTDIHGVPETRAKVSVRLVPNDQQAEIEFRIHGRAISENVGYNGPVTVYSTSNTTIDGLKRILIDADGVHGQPAQAWCSTSSVIQGIAARLRIVENIAWRKARQQKSAAEQVGNRKSEARVRRNVDEESDELIAKMNRAFVEYFQLPLRRKDHPPRSLRFATSDNHLLMTLLQAGTFQPGAPNAPPALADGLDMSIRVHESLVGNFSEGLVGGETLTDVRLAEMLGELTGEVPEELKPSPEKEPWSIQFAYEQPCTVRFVDQRISIAIRGRQFTRGLQTINEVIEISASYIVEKTPRGARLTREGEVVIEYPNNRTLSAPQIALKKFMKTKFDAVFEPEIVGKGMTIEGRSGRATLLQLQQLECEDGWAVFGWQASPEPLTAQRPSEIER